MGWGLRPRRCFLSFAGPDCVAYGAFGPPLRGLQ
jgi:hypothetical protein